MKLELSAWSIIKVLLVLAGAWLVFAIRDILALLFVVFILVAALGPTVEWFVRQKVPRILATSFILLLILAGLGLTVALVVPALVGQLQDFLGEHFPAIVDQLTPYYESVTQGRELLIEAVRQLQRYSGSVLSGIATIFGGLVSALTVLVLTFYLLVEEHPIQDAGLAHLPITHRPQIAKSLTRITDKLGAWLRGQFLLSLVVGIVTAIVMTLIGVPAPLAIGVIAGILEIIPIVGPMVTGLVMLLMASISPEDALLKIGLVIVYFVVLQLVEGQILVPKIMHRAIGLSPVIVIIALLVGTKLGGIGGAILAIPIAAILQVVIQDWSKLTRSSPT